MLQDDLKVGFISSAMTRNLRIRWMLQQDNVCKHTANIIQEGLAWISQSPDLNPFKMYVVHQRDHHNCGELKMILWCLITFFPINFSFFLNIQNLCLCLWMHIFCTYSYVWKVKSQKTLHMCVTLKWMYALEVYKIKKTKHECLNTYILILI